MPLLTPRALGSERASAGTPPLTELERRVLAGGYDPLMGIEVASNNVRRWLRAEVDRRLRELAVKLAAGSCVRKHVLQEP